MITSDEGEIINPNEEARREDPNYDFDAEVNPVFRKINSDLFRLQAHFEKINLDPKIGPFYLIFDPLGPI